MKRGLILFLLALILITPLLAIAQEPNITIPLQNKTNSALEKDVEIPEGFQILTRVFFGLKAGEPVSLQKLIVLFGVFLIFFFIIQDAITLVPFFDTTLKSILGSVLVTALMGVSGGFFYLVDTVMFLGSILGILGEWSILSLLISLFILIVIMFVLVKVLGSIKEKKKIVEAEETGTKTGAAMSLIRKAAEFV